MVWVTGAAGFIGRHLCAELLDQGWQVIAMDNLSAPHAPSGWLQLQQRQAQGAPLALFEREVGAAEHWLDLPQPECVFHLAGRPGVRDSTDFLLYARSNIEPTAALLKICAQRQISQLVFASSSSVYGDAPLQQPLHEDHPCAPRSVYGQSKLACETLISTAARETPLQAVLLRFFSVYGPEQRPDMAFMQWAQALWKGHALRLHDAETMVRDFTYVKDVVAGCLQAAAFLKRPEALCQPCWCFNLGSGQKTPLNQAVQQLILSFEQVAVAGLQPQFESCAAHPAEVRGTWADVRRARQFLRYVPRYTLAEGLQAFTQGFVDAVKTGETDYVIVPSQY